MPRKRQLVCFELRACTIVCVKLEARSWIDKKDIHFLKPILGYLRVLHPHPIGPLNILQ